LVLGIFAAVQAKKHMDIRKKHPGYPKGYWMNHGIGMGVPIGMAIGVAMGNIAVGVAIGVGIGTAIGSGLEKKHKDEIRPLTTEEEKLKRQSIMFSAGTLTLGMLVFVITYFAAK
jgi:hypothetical protein